MSQTFALESFDDFLQLAQAQTEPQRLLFVFTRRELPEGYTEAMKRRFEAGQGGHLAPVVCVDKAPQDLTSFRQLATESEDMVERWDVIFVAALPGQNGQYPIEDDTNKALDGMVESVRQGSISNYLAFDNQGTPLLLDGG
ncbi:ribonucleotide reductase subunit alpha [Natronospirillum operosum]|uniref:Ribonucleotide reductase subunit alpha n=1 Tax=Natronospirillum operosum TaxID=2759953 RepID=A0A4Z0WEP9_9GAMM|nr:ribonucleotide reductase subunit alpha [Natronospirillum operosum]TGG92796.1 ribonucleotide reductase subunit alpha [Natronospirillum operosum]